MEAIKLENIKNIEDKINDEKVKKVLGLYNDFEEKLALYNVISGKSIDISKTISPADYTKKFLNKKGIKRNSEGKKYIQDLKKFMSLVQKNEKENPYIDLQDITSRKNRAKIGEIIGELNPEIGDFVPADLDAIAVIKCYKLYETMHKIQQGQVDKQDIKTVLDQNGITQETYDKSKQKMQTYENLQRRELYDHIRKNKSDDIVHTVAATLEISPAEAEKDLAMFSPNYTKAVRPSKFEQSLQVDSSYVEYQSSYDQINRWESYIDTIMYDENTTENEKKLLIKEYKEKIERVSNTIEKNKNKSAEQNKIVRGKVGNFIAKGGNIQELSSKTLKNNGIKLEDNEPER